MLFSELQFWIFFCFVIGAYSVLSHRLQNRMLLLASYYFYANWDWRFLSLILFSTAVDFSVGKLIYHSNSESKRKQLLIASLLVNLGLLSIFKYFGFFSESFSALASSLGLTLTPFAINIILPVGISFYTFQTLSYTIDIYRKELKPTEDFFDFALFVAFFPQLIAGPIERAKNLLPNITLPRKIEWGEFSEGVVLCLLGLIKKIVIADGISPSVDAIYGSETATGIDILLATWLFAIQIYCDFSGYTDIARGVSKMLGFKLMLNFMQPYFSANPRDFWRRWHISLSSWLRDYLYIPLGGNKGGEGKVYRNLLLTMTLGGLWHGAALNFILWGIFQGFVLCAHRFISQRIFNTCTMLSSIALLFNSTVKKILCVFVYFQITCYGWLLFRANSLDQIVHFTKQLITIPYSQVPELQIPTPPIAAIIGISFLILWDILSEVSRNQVFFRTWPLYLRGLMFASMVYLLAFGGATSTTAFIYFQF